jgi:hypothetical protein
MSSTPPPDDERTLLPIRTLTGVAAPSVLAVASAAGNALAEGTRLGEFEITGLVGEGGFGIVYLAYDHSLQRRIALKEYMPSALAARTGTATVAVRSARHAETFQAGLRSFINEARLLAQFDHPSLVKVYRFWEANGTAYMVMPFYEGLTLKETLQKLGKPPDENWLKDLLRPLIDALAIIHREQCFHRDIAPDNILILKDGRPVLLDFGAARRVIGDMTHALTVILKPGYAPVEQYAEMPSMKQGAWTDIYALASVVYYAIAGQAPMPSIARLMSDRLEPLSKMAAGRYSPEFLSAIDKALAVKPEDRPQDVSHLRALLGLGDRRHRGRSVSAAPAAEAKLDAGKKPAAPLAPEPPEPSAPPRQSSPMPDPPPAARHLASAVPIRPPVTPQQPQAVPYQAQTTDDRTLMPLKRDAMPGRLAQAASASVQAFPEVKAQQQGVPREAQAGTPPPRSAPPNLQATAQPPKPESRKQGPLALYAIGAVVLLALIAGGVWFFSGPTSTPTNSAKSVPTPTSPRPAATSAEVVPVPDKQPVPKAVAAAAQVERKPFTPMQMLNDIFQGRDAEHAVAASVEKDQLRIGKDYLRFSITSAKPGYVYVLVTGTQRDFTLLFPNAVDKNNRITPGKALKLPSAQWPMKAEGPAGTHQFIAVVSDEPRNFQGLGTQPDDIFRRFSLNVGAQLYQSYSGPTPLYAGTTVCSAGAGCSQSYGAAVFSIEQIAGRAEERNAAEQPSPIIPTPAPKTAAAAAPKPEVAPAITSSSPKMEARSSRCSDILERASLGEALTQEEQTLLKKDCR